MPYWGSPWNFVAVVGLEKTRMMPTPESLTICPFILTQDRHWTDRQWTDRKTTISHSASIACWRAIIKTSAFRHMFGVITCFIAFCSTTNQKYMPNTLFHAISITTRSVLMELTEMNHKAYLLGSKMYTMSPAAHLTSDQHRSSWY